MKETLSNCERASTLNIISLKKRLDFRQTYDYRNFHLTFGLERGSCLVQLGQTRVLAQVSCQPMTPKQNRPAEGMLHINVETSPMASPQFEAGRQSDSAVEITRLLEQALKDSRCIDLESLCIVAGSKVWNVRLDVHILNHDGNLVDAACLASVAALNHFRRPDVSVTGEDVTIHTAAERDPVPLSIHHMPFCVTFAFFHQGQYLLVDPTEKEESVMDGKLVICMNKHRELCAMQMSGEMLLVKDQVLRCSNISVVKVAEMTDLVLKAIDEDSRQRSCNMPIGFAAAVESHKITTHKALIAPQTLKIESDSEADNSQSSSESESDSCQIVSMGDSTAVVGQGGTSSWVIDDVEDELMEAVAAKSKKGKQEKTEGVKVEEPIEVSDDEDDVDYSDMF